MNPYRYAGYRYDGETGFYYLNSRYYWPVVGRFITRDSLLGFADKPATLNLYGYVNGNPVKNIDPSGHVSVYVPWGGGKYVEATFRPNWMNLVLNSVVYTIVANGGWNGAYRIANELKWNYYKIFKTGFPVSTKSVAIEIIGHVIPDAFRETSDEVIDISTKTIIIIIYEFVAILLSVLVFTDCKRVKKSTLSALSWAVFSFICFPPIGFIVYAVYKKLKWL